MTVGPGPRTFQPLQLLSAWERTLGPSPTAKAGVRDRSRFCLGRAARSCTSEQRGEENKCVCLGSDAAKGAASVAAALWKAVGYLHLQPSKDEHNLWVRLHCQSVSLLFIFPMGDVFILFFLYLTTMAQRNIYPSFKFMVRKYGVYWLHITHHVGDRAKHWTQKSGIPGQPLTHKVFVAFGRRPQSQYCLCRSIPGNYR